MICKEKKISDIRCSVVKIHLDSIIVIFSGEQVLNISIE